MSLQQSFDRDFCVWLLYVSPLQLELVGVEKENGRIKTYGRKQCNRPTFSSTCHTFPSLCAACVMCVPRRVPVSVLNCLPFGRPQGDGWEHLFLVTKQKQPNYILALAQLTHTRQYQHNTNNNAHTHKHTKTDQEKESTITYKGILSSSESSPPPPPFSSSSLCDVSSFGSLGLC